MDDIFAVVVTAIADGSLDDDELVACVTIFDEVERRRGPRMHLRDKGLFNPRSLLN